mmetsp:Transcript_971/g.3864  ORF Transcript_971/g.3864 Transcript_971/m.3864 type:complete len:151 (+) Transcript_971:725-1177(+)
MLASRRGLGPGGPSRATLDAARRTLDAALWFGLLERIDEAMPWLATALGLSQTPRFPFEHAGLERAVRNTTASAVPDDLKGLVDQTQRLDLELYSYAETLLDARVAAVRQQQRRRRRPQSTRSRRGALSVEDADAAAAATPRNATRRRCP